MLNPKPIVENYTKKLLSYKILILIDKVGDVKSFLF